MLRLYQRLSVNKSEGMSAIALVRLGNTSIIGVVMEDEVEFVTDD